MNIKNLPSIGHVGIIVQDLEKAKVELRDVYGVEPGSSYDFVPQKVWAWGKEIDGCALRISITELSENLKVELLQPVSGDVEHHRFLKETGGGIHHTAHHVKDYITYRQYIIDKGGDIIFETETDDERGFRRCCYARMPETGSIVEILEIAHNRA